MATEKQTTDIDIEGFKIRIDELIKNNIMPEYFNSPLVSQWEITRACNLRCIHCYNNSSRKLPNELTHEEKIDVANQIVDAKIFRICISGGEPILSKSFWDIAEILNKGKIICNTISNGYLISDDTVDLYTKYFRHIQISLDGAKEETHDIIRGKKGSWERAVNACRLITDHNGNVSLASVISSYNIDEMDRIIDLSHDLKADEIRLEIPKFVGNAAKNRDELMLTKEQNDKFEKIINQKREQYKNYDMRIEVAPKNLGTYTRSFSKLPAMVLFISPTGTCAPDPVVPYSGGSLKNKTLKDIWDDLKTCHKDKDFIELSRLLKTGKDFNKLEKIPYVDGELHDK
jgi:MoaA/NifB/PqqE/SkfB family radical SAM enzyme